MHRRHVRHGSKERLGEIRVLCQGVRHLRCCFTFILQLTEPWKCLLSFGAESFVFQFAIQKFKD